MTIRVERLTDHVGARVTGVDLRKGLDEATMGAIRDAFVAHKVIVIPGQELSGPQQIAFTEWFGPRQEVRTVKVVDKGPQNYMYVANKSVEGMPGVLPDGEMQYHTDQCYYETPARATILFAIEIPSKGGNTKFSSAVRAFSALPDDLKAKLRRLKAHNVYDYAANATVKAKESSPDAPQYDHPMVIRHPESGEEVLYVNRLMTEHIVGMDRAESDALLERLFAVLEDPAYTYEHVWTPGDLVMWDNLSTLHARTWFDPKESRVLRRTSVAGQRPIAAFAAAA